MANQPNQGRRVKTADTIFDIVESLQELEGATTSEIADYLDLANSTAHDHLKTLEDKRYIVNEDGTYRLGLRFLEHGIYAQNQHPLSVVSQSLLEDLADETGEAAWLVVEEHGQAVYLRNAVAEQGLQTYGDIGTRRYLHTIAPGKAILAHLPEERVEEIIDEYGLPALTEKTITDREALFEELQEIREAGFALNEGGRILGGNAVGAPIIVDGELYGAIGVSGPESRLQGDWFREELPRMVLERKNVIELQLASQ